jgi:copper chaperone
MLSGLAGVQQAEVSLEQASAKVTYDPSKVDVAQMKKAVERAGYKAP